MENTRWENHEAPGQHQDVLEVQKKHLFFLPVLLHWDGQHRAEKGEKVTEADWATGIEEAHGCGLHSECAPPKAQKAWL